METARLVKRVLAYIFNLIFYLGLGFALAVPFLVLLTFHPLLYVLIAIGIAVVISFVLDFFFLVAFKGFTIGNAIMGVKYVSSDGKKINKRQAMVRSASETIVIFVLIDLIYFIKNRTERGVIDRLSDSFAIDIRL